MATLKIIPIFLEKPLMGFFKEMQKEQELKYWYKKGTNLLLKKFILTRGSPDSEDEDYDSGIKETTFLYV